MKSQNFHWIFMVYWSLKRNKDTRSLYEDTKIICGKGQRVIFTHSAILITADNNLTNCIPLIKVWFYRNSKKFEKKNRKNFGKKIDWTFRMILMLVGICLISDFSQMQQQTFVWLILAIWLMKMFNKSSTLFIQVRSVSE